MSNCKVGDLAIVIGDVKYSPGMLGRVVLVERAAVPGERIEGFHWHLDSPCIPWVIFGKDMNWAGDIVQRRVISDAGLRPIRPGDEDESIVRELYEPQRETA